MEGVEEHDESPLVESPVSTPRSPQKASSVIKTFGNIIVSIVGAGVLGLPYAYKQSGWLVGFVAISLIGVVTYYSMMLLVLSARKLRPHRSVRTMGDLGFYALGLPGQMIVDLMVVISQFGFCVGYLIFIGENLGTLFHTTRTLIILLLIPFQVILSWIRSLTGLAPFSLVADFFMAAAVCFVMGRDLVKGFAAIEEVKPLTTLEGASFVISVAVYCFEGFAVTQPIESSMQNPQRFSIVLFSALSLITLTYAFFGLFGYLAFGDSTKDIVTLNMGKGIGTVCVKVGLCVGLYFTFPVMMVPVYEVLDRKMINTKWFQESVDASPRLRILCFRAIRTLAVAFAAFVAISVPGFGVFVALIGSSVCAMLAFVLPALFHLRILGSEVKWWERSIDIALIVFGVVFGVIGTWNSIKELLF